MNVNISGNPSGRTVIFLAGWPDTADVFRGNIMAALESHYRIVGLTLPGFDSHSPVFHRKGSRRSGAVAEGCVARDVPVPLPVPRLGYSFENLVDLFEIAVLAAMENRPFERPMLVAHDWGCVITYEFLLSRPYFFARVVMLDVGGPVSNAPMATVRGDSLWSWWFQVASIILYQVLIIAAFLVLPDCVGRCALRLFLGVARRPQYRYVCTTLPTRNATGEEELLLVPSSVQGTCRRRHRPRMARLFELFNTIISLAGGSGGRSDDMETDGGAKTLAAAFHPGHFYYAKGTPVYTLPPHPNATGIHYTCYNCRSVPTANGREGRSRNSARRVSRGGVQQQQRSYNTPHENEEEAELCIVEADPTWGWIYVRYWMLWVSRLLPTSQRFLIPISVPVLFLYGTEKPMMLHSQQWVEHLEAKGRRDGSEAVSVPGGHWFFAERKNKKRVAERIAEFLDSEPYESLAG